MINHETSAFFSAVRSDSAHHFIGAQAPRADINMTGSAVDHYLNALNVRSKGPVGAPVGMGDLNAEIYTFAANITLCHL